MVYVCHADIVSAFRQIIISDSDTDGSESMSSHKISARATKLYRNTTVPETRAACLFLSCIHPPAQLLCLLPAYYHLLTVSDRMLQQWVMNYNMNTRCNLCVTIVCQNHTYYCIRPTHNGTKGTKLNGGDSKSSYLDYKCELREGQRACVVLPTRPCFKA